MRFDLRAFARARQIASLLYLTPLLGAACSGELDGDAGGRQQGGGGAPIATAPSSSSSSGGGAAASGGGAGAGGSGGLGGAAQPPEEGPCPGDMALVAGFCIDRFEAPNTAGALPLVMQSAVSAAAWCEERGKRLCTEDEWDTACQGLEASVYPYGDTHEAGRCNDGKTWIQPDEDALASWPSEEAQAEVDALYQAAPSGSLPGCVSSYGVYDLTGNVEEWVVRTRYHVNEYPHVLKGCYWSGCFGGAKPRCESTNPAHGDGFRFYETSFRCCRGAQ
jgi:formylglycine-generating enzyme required for sulfatase activity